MAKPSFTANSASPLHGPHFALRAVVGVALGLLALMPNPVAATTPLADQPVFSNTNVPGNLALTLSVEFPTAVSVAHTDGSYNGTRTYLGYFDPLKCYEYFWSSTEADRHFFPSGLAANRACTGTQGSKWSGNFLNWATMQTIDPFRWALTGGYRVVDTPALTIIEKAWASGQGGTGNFPNRNLPSTATVADNTPLSWSSMNMRIQGLGNQLRFTQSGNVDNTPTAYNPSSAVSAGTVYAVSVRVKVCDSNAGSGPMEPNCTAYPAGNYKPTGLIQQYADRIRYSAFGYLNDSNINRDGAALRARQKFVGPTFQLPASPISSNSQSEWDSNTGVFNDNPDPGDASDTAALFGVPVSNSGVINYLNKFGQITPGSYKTYDNVSELYYAALRYFRNLGNVPEWTSMSGASTATRTTWVDGFPVITNWTDPILYSCQRNFVLGIGDVNTHADKNVPGPTGSGREPSKPAAVVADTSVNAVLATNKVGQLHGLGSALGAVNPFNGCCSNNSALIAGLAYDANTRDIRPDDATKPQTKGFQSVQTYWLDVLEYSNYKQNNQYYLAAKYGGFKVPELFDPYTRATDIPLDWWSTSGESVYGQPKPDNYFVAARPDDMVNGLTRAFSRIAESLRAYTTSFSTAVPQVAETGARSYSAQFDSAGWTGELSAAITDFNALTGEPSSTVAWAFSNKLETQSAGTGWSTARRLVTWNNSSNTAVPFRGGTISAAQKAALNTIYRTGDDSDDYLNYLRGERLHEEASADSASSKIYRTRTKLLGDIVGSKPRVVLGPTAPYSDSSNPGYSAHVAARASRTPMVYVGSNSGMLHAVNATTGELNSGLEVFAYVPGSLYQGPTGSPSTTGLAARGDPDFTHKYFVDATPAVFEIDFGRTVGGSGTDWRTVLVGGLGKGGKSYYAIDITDPGAINVTTSAAAIEPLVAGRVLWEFSDPDLGYTFGEPASVKTKKHGWVLIFVSGYNNSNGRGYFFFVNPRTGALLEKVEARQATGPLIGSPGNQAGLAHVQAFVLDRTDGTADALYAGDLLGNLWRLDVRAASGTYPAPELLSHLTDSGGQARPVTTRPLVIVQPMTNTRWVTVGTGRLLDTSDISHAQPQAMFAIQDGTGLAFAAVAPTGFTYPIQLSKLKQLTDLTQKVVLDRSTEIGWYVDLGVEAGFGWRVIAESSSFFGVVEFTTMLPNGAICTPSGTSRVYAIDLGTGQSTLVQADGTTPLAFSTDLDGVATEQRSFSVGGKHRYVASSNTGRSVVIRTRQPPALNLRQLNWRELPLAN